MKAYFEMTAPVCTQFQVLKTDKNTQSSKVELAWFWKTVLLEMNGSDGPSLKQSLIFLGT